MIPNTYYVHTEILKGPIYEIIVSVWIYMYIEKLPYIGGREGWVWSAYDLTFNMFKSSMGVPSNMAIGFNLCISHGGRPRWLIRIDCTGLVTWRYQARIPVGPDICHRGFAYTVLQTVQSHGVYTVLLMLLCTIKNP